MVVVVEVRLSVIGEKAVGRQWEGRQTGIVLL